MPVHPLAYITRQRAVVALVVGAALGCRPAATPAGGAAGVPAAASAAEPDSTVSLAGWFQTVWGDTPHYLLVDDTGRSTELLLSEEVARPLGGPRAIDRKRVRVRGTKVARPAGALRVASIDLDTGGK